MQFGHKHAHAWAYYRMLVDISACLWESHALRRTKIMQFRHKHAHEHIRECCYIYWECLWESLYRVSHKHVIGARKLCSLVISMLMSILQNVGTYTGRIYENPYIENLISTLIRTRKLCSSVVSMLMIILQNVGTYTGRAYENPYIGCLISTP